jgi:hypothetical protein
VSAQASDANFPEIPNYQVKESDLVGDREWFLELTRQLHKTRAIAVGGILRQYMRELKEKNQDLIDESEETNEFDKASLFFRWKHKLQKYKIKKYLRVIKINRLIDSFKHHLCLWLTNSAAKCMAAFILVASAIPLPAISNAVP